MASGKIYGVLLAGGIGARMGNVDKPKQYMNLGGRPIIVYTIEKFVKEKEFEEVIVLTPGDWIDYTKELIEKYISSEHQVTVIEGGSTRNETIMNSIRYIEKNYGLDEDTIIVTHDAVRPYVTSRILKENIQAALEYGATDTVVPATDTIVRSDNNSYITDIPDRSKMYQGQTPQSFRAKELKETYESLTEEEKNILTDACKIYVLKGKIVHLIMGEVFNLKVTYQDDLKIAEALLGSDDE